MEVLAAHNPRLFGASLQQDESQYQFSRQSMMARFFRDAWRIIGRVVTCSRIKYRPDVLSFKLTSTPIAELTPTVMSFAEIADIRSAEALAEFKRRDVFWINLFWSGGIDSTVALVSLFKNWSPSDLNRLRFVMSEHSIAEYPWFYEKYIMDRYPEVNATAQPYDRFYEDALAITGEFGDQIFGSDLVEFVAQEIGGFDQLRKGNYADQLMRFFTARAGSRIANRFFPVYEPIVRESPVPIENAFDFLWWWNFSQKWQNVGYRGLLFSSPAEVKRNASNVFHFFESDLFQSWSLSNHDKKMPGGWDTYKMPAKEYIFEWTKDEDYLKKTKVRSLMNLSPFHQRQKILTPEFKFESDFYDCMRKDFFYGV